MKKIFTILAVIFMLSTMSGQITLANTFSTSVNVFKTHLNGYKMDVFMSQTLYIYNLNNTLMTSFVVPTQPWPVNKIGYVSQNLFDLDNSFEYFVFYNSGPALNGKFYIYNEDGTVLFFRDSVGYTQNVYYHPHALNIADFIYHDGVSTKLKLTLQSGKTEIYNLPGSIPCIDCTSGVISGFLSNEGNGNQAEDAKFFPNPTSGQLKLKYKLPEGSHMAEMKIYDMQGKLVDEFKVTDTFDFIYLPTNYNNGLYLYSLIVDGKVVKTEKIVLNK